MNSPQPIGEALRGLELPNLGITVEPLSVEQLWAWRPWLFRGLPSVAALEAVIAGLAADAARGVYRREMGPSRENNAPAIARYYAAEMARQRVLLERARFYATNPALPEEAAEEAKRAKREMQDLMRERWANSGVPEPFKRLTWAGLVDRDPSKRPLVEALAAWRETPDWLVLHGEAGRGKTGAACCLLKDFARLAQSVLFVRVPSVLADLRRSYDPERRSGDANLLDRLHNVEVLVLDDLGAERLTESGWVLETLDLLIDGRWSDAARRRTIVTTNIAPLDLADRVGPRISSRLIGSAVSLEVGGDDLRMGAAA